MFSSDPHYTGCDLMWVEVQEQETSGCTLASDWLWVKGVGTKAGSESGSLLGPDWT